jgi:hypothetical protein
MWRKVKALNSNDCLRNPGEFQGYSNDVYLLLAALQNYRRPPASWSTSLFLELVKDSNPGKDLLLQNQNANHIPLATQKAKPTGRKWLEDDCSESNPTCDPVFQINLQIAGDKPCNGSQIS